MNEGAVERQRLIDSGFTDTEVQKWQSEETNRLVRGGFAPQEIDEYWGVREPDLDPIKQMFEVAFDDLDPQERARVAESPMDALRAGWQLGNIGMGVRGTMPDVVLPEDAGTFSRVLQGAGVLAGDAPAAIAGFVAGATVAAPTLNPVAIGAAGGAGSAALPQAIREIMMDLYVNGDVKDFNDAWTRASGILWGTTKAAISGAAGGAVGAKVGGVVLGKTGSRVAGSTAEMTAFATAATGVNGALEGRIPDAEDFMAGAVLAIGFTAAGALYGTTQRFVANRRGEEVAANLRTIYEQTGIPPWEAVNQALSDVTRRAEILSPRDILGNPVTPGFNAVKPTEPKPYKPYKPEVDAKTIDKVKEELAAKLIEQPAKPAATTLDHYLGLVDALERSDAAAKRMGVSVDEVVSPAGAVGRYQVTPDTAVTYGYDPRRLTEPAYNKRVAETILADLAKRYDGDVAAMMIAYNAGPGRANRWIKSGRNNDVLPLETQRYLERAEAMGAFDGTTTFRAKHEDRVLTVLGDIGDWVPTSRPKESNAGGGGRLPPREPPDITPPSEAGRRKIETDIFQLNEESTALKILDIIADPAKPGLIPDWLNPRKHMHDFQSLLVPARVLDRKVGVKKNELSIEDMMRQTFASASRVKAFMETGVVDPLTLTFKNKQSMKAAFEAVKEDGGTSFGFWAARLAARTVEKERQGISTGINVALAKRYLAFPSVKKQYTRGMAIMRDVKDGAVDYMVDSGRISSKLGDAMKDLNREHIVMQRVQNPTYNPARVPGGRHQAPKKMKGSDREIVNPATAEADNLMNMIASSDWNRAIGDVVGRIEAHNKTATATGKGLIPLNKNVELTREIREIFEKKKGLDGELFGPDGKPIRDEYGNPISGPAKEAAENWLADQSMRNKLGPDDFLYYREGVPEVWTATDPNLAAVLALPLMGKARPLPNLLIHFANMQRAGLTSMPDFAFRSVSYGQIMASAFGEGGAKMPYHDLFRGIYGSLTKNGREQYALFEAEGGANSTIAWLNKNYLDRGVAEIFEQTGTGNRVVNVLKHPISSLMALSHMADNAARFGARQRLVAKGVPPIKATMMTKKLYLDHAEPQTAAFVNWWARMTPFSKVAIKDTEMVLQAMRDRPVGTLAWAFTVITLPTILNYVANMIADEFIDEENAKDRYVNKPRWMRDMYWVLPEIDGHRMKIKRPPSLGSLMFGTMPERFMDYAYGNDPGSWKSFFDSVVTSTVPPAIPSFLTPIVEDIFNEDLMTGRPLVKSSLEEASGYMQYGPTTSETAKALARVLGAPGINVVEVSPIELQNYVSEWMGTLPMTVLKTLEAPFKDEGRPKEWADTPVLGAFFVREMAASDAVDRFYERYDKIVAAHADLRLALERNDPREIEEASRAEAVISLTEITSGLRDTFAAIRAVEQDKEMSQDEKGLFIDQLGNALHAAAQSGLYILDELEGLPPGEPVTNEALELVVPIDVP